MAKNKISTCLSVATLLASSLLGYGVEISTTTLPAGKEMNAYASSLTYVGGISPVSWTVSPVVSWGSDSNGRRTIPSDVGDVVDVSAGWLHSLALRRDGTVVGWGYNVDGQAGIPADLTGVVAVSAGLRHSLALKAGGQVVAWGCSQSQYDHGQADVPSTGLGTVIAIEAGVDHSVALSSNGDVSVWGDNTYGQTDLPLGLEKVACIAAGAYHSVASLFDGTVVAWGASGSRDLGQATVPAGLDDVVEVAAGLYHSLALRSDGTVVAWGNNGHHQCDVPVDLDDVVDVEAGIYFSIARKSDGSLVFWGLNSYGQAETPEGVHSVQIVSGGLFFSLAVCSDGALMPAGLSLSSSGDITGKPIQNGNYEVPFLVTDASGVSMRKELPVLVSANANTRPTINIFSPSDRFVEVLEGQSVTFDLSGAVDPEGSSLNYLWMLNGKEVARNTAAFTVSAPWYPSGVHDLRCYVSDELWKEVVNIQWDVYTENTAQRQWLSDNVLGYAKVPEGLGLRLYGTCSVPVTAGPIHGTLKTGWKKPSMQAELGLPTNTTILVAGHTKT